MSPRSLVGMTQGARKRAARITALCVSVSIARNVPKGVERAYRLARFKDARMGHHVEYAKARALYRVGERLRPCPWRHDDRGCMGEGESDCCHGSGVIPARKRGRP